MKVGVFDSGIGGLSVVKSLLEHKLFEEIIYYGDTARVPYGAKDKNTIIRYSLEALEFFKNFDIDMLIIACNTVSAFAIYELKQACDIPVIGVIKPGVLAVKNHIKNKQENILVIATKGTINSNRYANELKKEKYLNVTSLQTGLFVSLVEEGIFEGDVLSSTLDYYFKDLKEAKKIHTVILACTHFPLLEKEISKYFDNCKTIHSGNAIVEFIKEEYNYTNTFKKSKISFFATENPDNLKKIAKLWLGSLING